MSIKSEYEKFKKCTSLETEFINKTEWEFVKTGRGKDTLLILNGGLRVAESAFRYINLFKDDFNILVPSYPSIKSIDELIEGVEVLLKKYGVGKIFVLCQSYGAIVGECFIKRFPQQISKIVISGAAPLEISFREKLIINFRTLLIKTLPGKIVSQIYKKNLLKVIDYNPEDASFWMEYLDYLFENFLSKKDALSHFQSTIEAIKKYSYKKSPNSYMGDVLILKGEDDKLISDLDIQKVSDYYKGSKIEIIKKSGHTSAFMNPDYFKSTVREFLIS